MKIHLPVPFEQINIGDEFFTLEAITKVSQTAERVGFDSISVGDHPIPTTGWLAGGHLWSDPFVLLSFIGAVTTKLRLRTGVVVLPYRNPFLLARMVASLDRYSNGRVVLAFGRGYLKGEYKALGVDFEKRNELMDEYLNALKLALSGEPFAFEGTGYSAKSNIITPGPIQKPHPPILVGGNTKRAIRRAVELADSWNPFFTRGIDSIARTKKFSDIDDVIEAIDYLKAYSEEFGREIPPSVVLGSISSPEMDADSSGQKVVDLIEEYRALGVEGLGYFVQGKTANEWCDNAERFGELVISKVASKLN